MARAFHVQPVDATFGAVVTDLRLAALDDATCRQLHAIWLEYALLSFPGQHLAIVAAAARALHLPETSRQRGENHGADRAPAPTVTLIGA
jgi:alpha-ketoglutarate-dependent taurine dioxygenase